MHEKYGTNYSMQKNPSSGGKKSLISVKIAQRVEALLGYKYPVTHHATRCSKAGEVGNP